MRINKYLSLCGLGSRRKVEELVEKGRVRVNGSVVRDLSCRIDPDADIVELDGTALNLQRYYYIMLNKPKGYITSVSDEMGRAVVMHLIPEKYRRAGVVPVGRLDKDSEGLLLLTNDGDTAYRLTHPRFDIEKQYQVTLDKPLDEKAKKSIEKGVYLYGEKAKPAVITSLSLDERNVKVAIREGKKRHIRLSFDKFGYKVRKLKRISFGPLTLGGLHSGDHRLLHEREIKALKKVVSSASPQV